MRGRRPGPLVPGAFFRTLKARIPELFRLADLDLELFSNVDSSEMQPEDWGRLASLLHARLSAYDGAVITHGTDTLAYTAAALSFMLEGLKKPVVLTGAQRPLGEVRSDARLNLIDAVTSALHGPREVTVCFDSRLFRGNRVRKSSVAEYDAFDSPNAPPLGTLGVEAKFEPGLKLRGRFTVRPKVVPDVLLLKVVPGFRPEWAMGLLSSVRGVVLEAYGAGNFPVHAGHGRSLRPFLKEARRRGVPVVLVSQAQKNGIDLSLYEAGAVARDEGAISGGDMTATTAIAKLMHTLAYCESAAQVRATMERNVAGERIEQSLSVREKGP